MSRTHTYGRCDDPLRAGADDQQQLSLRRRAGHRAAEAVARALAGQRQQISPSFPSTRRRGRALPCGAVPRRADDDVGAAVAVDVADAFGVAPEAVLRVSARSVCRTRPSRPE
jgi:hypothetical protein